MTLAGRFFNMRNC